MIAPPRRCRPHLRITLLSKPFHCVSRVPSASSRTPAGPPRLSPPPRAAAAPPPTSWRPLSPSGRRPPAHLSISSLTAVSSTPSSIAPGGQPRTFLMRIPGPSTHPMGGVRTHLALGARREIGKLTWGCQAGAAPGTSSRWWNVRPPRVHRFGAEL